MDNERAVPPCGALPGDVLEQRYRLERVVGSGGQAVVFQATELDRNGRPKRLGRPLALKVVRTDLPADLHHEAVEGLRWEADLLQRVRHQALPRFSTFQSDATRTWLARELVEGTPLSAWARPGQATPHQVQQWALQLCNLLCYLHTLTPPIICGDLKPDNLMVRGDGVLVLIDLGAGQMLPNHPSYRPRPQYGTPGYASPEQMGNRGMDERSDMFSLAVVCYELLTGHDPSDAPLQFDLERLDAVAPAMAPVLRRALALEPAQRPPTASAFRAMLAPPQAVKPLALTFQVRIISRDDLLAAALHHTQRLEQALKHGTLEHWLALHPDPALGNLLHNLRTMRQHTPAFPRLIDAFFAALAPSEKAALQLHPHHLIFAAIPHSRWQVWSTPRQLHLQNSSTLRPVRWEVLCPADTDVQLRIQVEPPATPDTPDYRNRHEGVLPPGGQATINLVAAGTAKKHQGTLLVRCGLQELPISWVALGVVGLPVGNRFIKRLEELDLSEPDVLLPALEALLEQGTLQRWLREQGKRKLANDLTPPGRKPFRLDRLQLRLLALRLLHRFDGHRFPLLNITTREPGTIHITAGESLQYVLELENQGHSICRATWKSSTWPWARVLESTVVLPPATRSACTIWLMPPATLPPTTRLVTLELQAGAVVLPVSLTVHVGHKGRGVLRRLREWLS